jgi:hypothetical protein
MPLAKDGLLDADIAALDALDTIRASDRALERTWRH